MSTIYAFALATAIAFSQPLHAHSCSGGIDGGMDATGNQCNGPVSETTHTPESAGMRPIDLRGADGSARVRPLAVRPSKSSRPQYRATVLATPTSRFAALPAIQNSSAKKAQITGTSEATCSSGGDGGMDPSGNQCSNPLAALGHPIATSIKAP